MLGLPTQKSGTSLYLSVYFLSLFIGTFSTKNSKILGKGLFVVLYRQCRVNPAAVLFDPTIVRILYRDIDITILTYFHLLIFEEL